MTWDIERSRRPEMLLSEIVKDAASNKSRKQFLRARVLAYDTVGGQLQNPDGAGEFLASTPEGSVSYRASVGPANPPGSVKARVLSDGADSIVEDVDTRVFWPLSQDFVSVSLVPGEHVLVFFEDDGRQHGIWIGRVSGHVGQNYAPGESSYVEPRNRTSAVSAFEDEDVDYEPDDYGEAPRRDLTGLFDAG